MTQKRSIVFMLVDRALKLGHPEFAQKNLDLIITTLRNNDYPMDFIRHWMHVRINYLREESTQQPAEPVEQEKRDFKSTVILPYAEGLTQNLARIAKKHGLNVISSNTQKLQRLISSTKDRIDKMEKTNCVYSIPCGGCDGAYIGQTKRALSIRVEKHRRSCRHPAPAKHTALSQHSWDFDHEFNHDAIRVLGQESNQYKRNLLEMVFIMKNKSNINFRTDVAGLNIVYSNLIN